MISIPKSLIIFHTLGVEPCNLSRTRIYSYSSSSCACAVLKICIDQRLLWKSFNYRRRFHVSHAVQPGAPPPSQPPFNFIDRILGIVTTVILPFLVHKWTSLAKLKNAVETADELILAVEKVVDVVEKVAEDISGELPEGGKLQKAVDFVEDAAERASSDARLVEEIIDKVQEAEKKVDACVESLEEERANLRQEEGGGQVQETHKEEAYGGGPAMPR